MLARGRADGIYPGDGHEAKKKGRRIAPPLESVVIEIV